MTIQSVLVTGASGHIGAHVVHALLEAGIAPRCAVRGAADPSRHARLRALPVELVEADVTDAAQVERAVAGVDGVIHLATAYKRISARPHDEILRPALEGTEHVIASCHRHRVRKLVYTSSVAAVGFARGGVARDEAHWNEAAFNPYSIAKRDAEKKAWLRAAQLDVPMVALCPATVLGPGFTRHTPSTLLMQRFLDGRVPAMPPITLSYVDARDIAQAHVQALLRPVSNQRYVLASQPLSMPELVQRLRLVDSSLRLPRREMGPALFALMPAFDWLSHKLAGTARDFDRATYREMKSGIQLYDSSKAARDLGWQPRPLMQTLADTLAWLRTTDCRT
ncbi:MAG: NAD-dependent epimerase/dehydratase family protein [Gammaproteobacteria bacterium]